MNLFKISLSCLMVMAAGIVNGSVITVDTTAGGLKSAVGDNAATATGLVVTGQVDASDIQFINFDMPALKSLDLSAASIVAYSGATLLNGRSATAANMLPEYSFIDSRMTSVDLPQNIRVIGEGAFAKSDITSIAIPASVGTIGDYAFTDCDGLTAVALPANLTMLGDGVFANCDKLATVTLGDALTEVGTRVFAGCPALASVTFPASLRSIGDMAFYGTAIKELKLSGCKSFASVGDWAFANCAGMTAVYLPSTSFTIGRGSFFSDGAISGDVVTLIGASDSIPAYSFTDASSMTIGRFQDAHIVKIGDYALRGLSEVDSLQLPASLDYIGSKAMAGWVGLEGIDVRNLGEKVPELGDEVWQGVAQGDVKLIVTSDQAPLFSATPQWRDFLLDIQDPLAIDEITSDAAGAAVKGYISGDLLTLESQGAEILGFQLYDLQGRTIAVPAAVPANVVTVGVETVGSPVVVVRVLLADNTVAVLKLAR